MFDVIDRSRYYDSEKLVCKGRSCMAV